MYQLFQCARLSAQHFTQRISQFSASSCEEETVTALPCGAPDPRPCRAPTSRELDMQPWGCPGLGADPRPCGALLAPLTAGAVRMEATPKESARGSA